MREEELRGFRIGLFGSEQSFDLAERAHTALSVLSELRAMIQGTREVAENPDKPADPADIVIVLRQFRETTRIAEHEIHEAVLSCARARRTMPGRPMAGHTLH